MDDTSKKESERKARDGEVIDKARIIAASLRDEPREKTVQRLSEIQGRIRDEVLNLTVENDEERGRLNALAMVCVQIEDSIRFAMRTRKGDAELPSGAAIMHSIMREMTSERAREMLLFHKPTLVLTPITSLTRYLEEIREVRQIRDGSRNLSLSEFARDQINHQAVAQEVDHNRIRKWRFAITEGSQVFDIPEWDNGEENFEQRIRRFNLRFTPNKIFSLDYASYIALANRGFLTKNFIDDCGEYESGIPHPSQKMQFTLLNEMEFSEFDPQLSRVGVASCSKFGQFVTLGDDRLHDHGSRTLFRPAIMGDIS